MSENYLKHYDSVTERLLKEAFRCTPKNWTKYFINIVVSGNRIDYMIKNDDQEGKAVLSKKFCMLCEEVYQTYKKYGDDWVEANFVASQDEAGEWSAVGKFRYQPRPSKYPIQELINCIWDCCTESLPENWYEARLISNYNGNVAEVVLTYVDNDGSGTLSCDLKNKIAPANAATEYHKQLEFDSKNSEKIEFILSYKGKVSVKKY